MNEIMSRHRIHSEEDDNSPFLKNFFGQYILDLEYFARFEILLICNILLFASKSNLGVLDNFFIALVFSLKTVNEDHNESFDYPLSRYLAFIDRI